MVYKTALLKNIK